MLGRTLSHYRIEDKIGAGGMGEVYRARDEHLERDVAIKVLPSGTLADEHARKRFRKEAHALSKLNHPNIATVFDFDTLDKVDFIVMELVEGVALSEKLKAGPLTEKEVTALGTQIADALEEAHEHGIVHRDLKPGNIAVTAKGRAKVLDFGLARMLRPVSDEATTEVMTEELSVAGTLPYMSPEELKGERADHRSDLYSFGVVLYEMATGKRPFEHTVSTALADAIIHKPPEPPSSLNRKVSPGLESIILKSLDKDPDHRYQSAREMRVDLARLSAPVSVAVPKRKAVHSRRWLWASAGVIAAMAILFALNVGGLRDRLAGKSGPRIDSIAVLPLENLSGDPEQEYFADGMTEALIAELGKIRALRTISRQSVMRYKGSDESLQAIASRLNVDALVEGSVLRSEDRVRIIAQLVQASPEQQLWSESYERDLKDVLALQGEVARSIAREIHVTVTPQEQSRLTEARSVHPEAHLEYLRGRHAWAKKTPQDLMQALTHYERAIEIDPEFALAYAELASTFWLLGGTFADEFPPAEAMARAKTAANRALEIDPNLTEGHAALGFILTQYEWDWSGAERAFKRALELNPGNEYARLRFAFLLSGLGRHDEALAEMRRAQESNPLNLDVNGVYGLLLHYAGRNDQAIEQLQTTLAFDPDHPVIHRFLGFWYVDNKMYDEAIVEFQAAARLAGNNSLSELAFLGAGYAAAGKRAEAMDVLQDLEERSTRQHVPAHTRAFIYTALGEIDRAVAWWERAFEEHSPYLMYMQVHPGFDPIRSDPRFQDLLRRMNFPE
jgi:serine/threonine-protein kinase